MGRLLTAVLAALPESIRTYAAARFTAPLLGTMFVAFAAAVVRVAPMLQTAVNFAVLFIVIIVTAFVALVIGLIALRLLQLAYRSWREGSSG